MKTAFNIARVELQVLFYSPIAWFILIMFTFRGISYQSGDRQSFAGRTLVSGFLFQSGDFRNYVGVSLSVYPFDHDGTDEPGAGKRVDKVTLFVTHK